MATLLSAFSITAFADDNATGGDGTTHGASDGYGWYNTNEFMWKVTLFVGKSDQATKQSSLTNDFYRIGTDAYLPTMSMREFAIPLLSEARKNTFIKTAHVGM